MSKIEWTDRTWNPITGCTKVSPGCANCYAEKMALRLQAMGVKKYENGFKLTLHEDALTEPLHWKKPSRIFVCSMGDLFHEDVPFEVIDEVFGIMLAENTLSNCGKHTFQILTKRAERMHSYFNGRTRVELLKSWAYAGDCIHMDDEDMFFHEYIQYLSGGSFKVGDGIDELFPLKNVWLGVTAENQEQADKRIPYLLAIPAAKRFVSIEPMLGQVDVVKAGAFGCDCNPLENEYGEVEPRCSGICEHYKSSIDKSRRGIDWVIVGGESGPSARPMKKEWVLNIKQQCDDSGVPFFFKQWGAYGEDGVKRSKKANGCLFDGQVYQAMPEANNE